MNARRTDLLRICALTLAAMSMASPATAQTPATQPTFEVATVKPILMDASHPFDPKHYGPNITSGGASYWGMSVADLIAYAYRVDALQVTGPTTMSTSRFDIETRFPEGANKKDERQMLQALLQDRFKLALHKEKKDLEVYVLLIEKHGEKLHAAAPDPIVADSSPMPPAKPPMTVKFDSELWAQHFEFSKTTIAALTKMLPVCLGLGPHKVVDETGLKGTYQVVFDCPVPRPHLPAAPGAPTVTFDSDDHSALTRSLDTLGLRLEQRKLPMDVYVVDHVEPPSAN